MYFHVIFQEVNWTKLTVTNFTMFWVLSGVCILMTFQCRYPCKSFITTFTCIRLWPCMHMHMPCQFGFIYKLFLAFYTWKRSSIEVHVHVSLQMCASFKSFTTFFTNITSLLIMYFFFMFDHTASVIKFLLTNVTWTFGFPRMSFSMLVQNIFTFKGFFTYFTFK